MSSFLLVLTDYGWHREEGQLRAIWDTVENIQQIQCHTSHKAANVRQAASLDDADARRLNYNADQAAGVSIVETLPATWHQHETENEVQKKFKTRFKRRFRRTDVRKNMKIFAQMMTNQTAMRYKGWKN